MGTKIFSVVVPIDDDNDDGDDDDDDDDKDDEGMTSQIIAALKFIGLVVSHQHGKHRILKIKFRIWYISLWPWFYFPRDRRNLCKAYSWIKHMRITLTEDIDANYVKQINIRETIKHNICFSFN